MRRRIAILKWAAGLTCALLVILFAESTLRRHILAPCRQFHIVLARGGVEIAWCRYDPIGMVGLPGWYWRQIQFDPFHWSYWTPRYKHRGIRHVMWIPLWIPIVGLAGMTWVAWRSGRTRPGGCAFCRYDLCGLPRNPDAPLICPECGAAATERTT